jgi:hypothetical protein
MKPNGGVAFFDRTGLGMSAMLGIGGRKWTSTEVG